MRRVKSGSSSTRATASIFPAGYRHQYYNMGQGNAEFVFGIAPGEMGSFGTGPVRELP